MCCYARRIMNNLTFVLVICVNVIFLTPSSAFYIPGIRPHTFMEGEEVRATKKIRKKEGKTTH
jgi:hypothetical protein